MFQSGILNQSESKKERIILVTLMGLIVVETVLVGFALIPTQLWSRILPQSTTASLDGPFPPVIAPLITFLLYMTPTAIGLLCQQWQRALVFATLPAWIGLGIFLVAATFRIGIFYLVSPEHVTANVSMLELFALLGGMGWLARPLLRLR
jgi:hypothetical protein